MLHVSVLDGPNRGCVGSTRISLILGVLIMHPRSRCVFDVRSRRAGWLPAGVLALASACSSGPAAPDNPDAAPEDLRPGTFLSPLVQLQRLQGVEDHLHVDEVRLREDGLLLQCSYT